MYRCTYMYMCLLISSMADPKEEFIVISDEEPGAEIISSDDDHESPLSGINPMNGAQPILIGADPRPEDEQPINGSAYAHYGTPGEREAVVIQGISSRDSNSQQIASLASRQASVVIVSRQDRGEPAQSAEHEQQRGRVPLHLESAPASVITFPEDISSQDDQSYSPSNMYTRIRSLIDSTLDHNRNAMMLAEGEANQMTTQGCTQATPATQRPGDRNNNVTEATIQVTTVSNSHDTNRSMPIVISESPPRSVVHMNLNLNSYVTTTSISSGCHVSVANQESGTVHSVGAASTQVAGSNSRSTQLIPSQVQQITVNARVLDNVVKLAAFSCASLYPRGGNAQQHEINLYRLLTNAEASQDEPRPALSLLGATSGVHVPGNTQESETSNRTSVSSSGGSTSVLHEMDKEVIYIPPTLSKLGVRQEGASSEPIVLGANQSPEEFDTHTGGTPVRMNIQSSTPTAASKTKESTSLTTRGNLSLHNESSFNSTLTEIMPSEASFDDGCPTPVPNFRSVLRREISNESTWSLQSAPPRKRPKMTDRNKRANSVTTIFDNEENQALRPTPGLAEINNKEVMITNQTPPDLLGALISPPLPPESANLGGPMVHNPSFHLRATTGESSSSTIMPSYGTQRSFSMEENSISSTQTTNLTEQELSSDSSACQLNEVPKQKKKKRKRCGECENCRIPDCSICRYCMDKKRYHQPCIKRKNKPCLRWSQGGQSSSSGAPVHHPPSLIDLRLSESDNESDDEFHERLDRALRDGYVEIFTAKCGVSGPPGTGKSHFRALISGKNRPAHRQSTALATEADQIIPAACVTHDFEEEIVEFHRNKSGSKVKWLVVKSKKLSLLIAKTIHNQTKGSRSASGGGTSLDAASQSRPQQKRRISSIRKVIKKHLKMLSTRKGKPKCLNKMKLLYIVDTGGQPQFQEIMPIFVRNSSVTLLVHKLNESLDQCPRFDYEINGVRYSVPDEMLVTNREYLEQSLRTICSCIFSRNITKRASRTIPKPHFAVIGMFKDQCSDEMLQEKHRAVNECIRPFTQSKKCVALTPSRHVHKPVFCIDGSEEGWAGNGDVIDDLHAHIERVTEGLGVKTPIRWFLFLNLLKDHKSPFLSLTECYGIAEREDIMMDKSDVDDALLLFDELNLILYFPNILRNVVFCSPEFLFNKVSEIIAQSFDCREDRSGLPRQERLEFHRTGIFTRDLLERVRSLRSGFDEVTFNVDNLLYLLVKLCIIAEVSHDRFFIPCVLALHRKEHNSQLLTAIRLHMQELGIEPLLISFPFGYSPRGIFCASVAHLAKLSNWVVESAQCQLERKRNLIEFELRDLIIGGSQVHQAAPLGRVVIMDMVSHIEVYSTCEQEHLRDIRRTIYGALWCAAESLSYSPTDMEVNVGFSCRVDCGVSEPHGTAATFSQKTRKWSSKCIRNSSKRARQLTPQQMVWFTSENDLSGPVATLPDLLNEVAPHTNKWEEIGLQLDFSHTDIERIKIEEQERIEACFIKVFNKWETKLIPPFTWPVIISALESPSVAEFRLASQLKARHLIASEN